MNALGKLLALVAGKFAALTIAIHASAVARRLLFVAWLGALYLGCVMTFTSMVAPWFSALLQFGGPAGAVVGLLFPPVAGSVLGSLVIFWGSVASMRYTSKLSTIVFKD